jgi:hypothetical protein
MVYLMKEAKTANASRKLKCIQCGNSEFQPEGTKGYVLRNIFQQIGFRFFPDKF